MPEKVEKPKTNAQGLVEKLVRSYTSGTVNEAEFRKSLKNNGVSTDNQFDKLIAKHEAGTFVSHRVFGQEAIRRIAPPSTFNHSNKINLCDPSYVAKDKVGENLVKKIEEIKQTYHEDTTVPYANQRYIHEVADGREIFNKKVYLQVKGKPKIPVQVQIQSSDPDILKWNKSSSSENAEAKFKPAKTIINDERSHHKLYTHHGDAKVLVDKPNDIHRTSYTAHPAARTSFNIFGF